MASFDLPRLAVLDEAAIACFRANGFLIVEDRTAWIDAYCETGRRTAPQAHA